MNVEVAKQDLLGFGRSDQLAKCCLVGLDGGDNGFRPRDFRDAPRFFLTPEPTSARHLNEYCAEQQNDHEDD